MQTELSVLLGKRVRRLRRLRGWRQIDLAEHAAISQTHVSDVELARREVCLFTLEKIATALDTTPSRLLEMPAQKR